MRKIRTAIIGAGFIGPVHIEALRRIGMVDVVAIADADLEVANLKAIEFFIDKVYGDYRELLKDDSIDAIHICTPNFLHYSMAREVLLAGKNVICDKPLALTSAQARELIVIAKEKGVVAAMNFNIRCYPLVRQIKAMIDNGDLGTIFAINGSYQQDWLQKDTDYSWRLEPDKSGESRAIADIGSHWMDCAEYMTGKKITSVCADFATFYPMRKKPLKPVETYSGKLLSPEDYEDVPISTEDYSTVLLHFDNGAHGSLTVNQVAAGRKNRILFEIYGSKTSVCLDTERPNELWIGKRDGNNEQMIKDPSLAYDSARQQMNYPGGHNEGFPDTFKQNFKKIYTYLFEKMQGNLIPVDFPTFEDGLRELELCERIVSSAKGKCWLDI